MTETRKTKNYEDMVEAATELAFAFHEKVFIFYNTKTQEYLATISEVDSHECECYKDGWVHEFDLTPELEIEEA